MQFFQDHNFVNVREKLKHTRPGRHQDQTELIRIPFTQDTRLCVVQCLKSYINRTKEFRVTSLNLFLSYIKPFKPVGKETIARWIKSVLKVSGLDKFPAHSCCSASTSRNQLAGLSLSNIMRSAGWSNASTFAKHYNKPIINENFGDCLLSDFVDSM